MAPQQQNTEIPATSPFKKPAVKIFYLGVAGLIAIIVLLFQPFSSKSAATNTLSLNKQAASSGSGGCPERKKQVSNASTFSLMPGRLNRFLQ